MSTIKWKDGLGVAENSFPKSEFIRSTDAYFRPVWSESVRLADELDLACPRRDAELPPDDLADAPPLAFARPSPEPRYFS